MNRLIPHMLATMATIAMLGLARPGSAQERPAPVAEVHGGTLLFADNSVVKENFIGGAGRFYVLPRLSVGPEIAYIRGTRHSHLMLTGNLTFDLLGSTSGRPPRVTPFIVAGAGLFQTREQFPGGDLHAHRGRLHRRRRRPRAGGKRGDGRRRGKNRVGAAPALQRAGRRAPGEVTTTINGRTRGARGELRDTTVRLKPDTTSSGPAEAGHYDRHSDGPAKAGHYVATRRRSG